jgi:hypothetical protein
MAKKTSSEVLDKEEIRAQMQEELILSALKEIVPEPFLEGVLKRARARRLSLRESLRRVVMAAIHAGEL